MNPKMRAIVINTVAMTATIAAAILIGSQAPRLYHEWRGNVRTGDFAEHVANQPQRLTLYGTTTCQYCAKAREYLTKHGLPFNDRTVDTSKDAAAMFAKLQENGVPVLVSGHNMVVGFSEKDYATFTQNASK